MHEFSVLMSFYEKDDPKFLDEALESLHQQTFPPHEIVLIQDGKVSFKLEETVQKWERVLPIKRIVNKENLGLGKSLKKGLKQCSHSLVARMDADDICHPARFEEQVNYLVSNQDISVVGGWIAEFSTDPSSINSYRKLPSNHLDLLKYAKKRCPLNHPTVMYRKEDILKAGGYGDFRFQQDYQLWGRLLKAGFKIGNIPKVLLYMRADTDLFNRRGGMEYFQNEIKVQKYFLSIGFINRYEFFRNYFVRGSVRLVPNFIRKSFYQYFLR